MWPALHSDTQVRQSVILCCSCPFMVELPLLYVLLWHMNLSWRFLLGWTLSRKYWHSVKLALQCSLEMKFIVLNTGMWETSLFFSGCVYCSKMLALWTRKRNKVMQTKFFQYCNFFHWNYDIFFYILINYFSIMLQKRCQFKLDIIQTHLMYTN